MCRLCAVLSDDAVLLADFLLRPRMSLVWQSYAAQERRQLPHGVLPSMAYQQHFLNADGFGVGWYSPSKAPGPGQLGACELPCVFTSLKPAWNDPNLRNISEEVRSPLVLAHVRAAGPELPVSDSTCHPFKAGRFLFAHNGMVGAYSRVRRELMNGLSEYGFHVAVEHGCIDSAVAFGILLTELGIVNAAGALREYTADEMCGALYRTIQKLVNAVGGEEESLLNFVVLDGQRIVACRFATAPHTAGLEEQQPLGVSLYLSVGSRWVAQPDDPQAFRMRKGADIKSCTAILSSEPLTPIREEWLPIAPNSFVVCGLRRGQLHNIDVLMYPVMLGPPSPLSALLGVEMSATAAPPGGRAKLRWGGGGCDACGAPADAAAESALQPRGGAPLPSCGRRAPSSAPPGLLPAPPGGGQGPQACSSDVWMTLTGQDEDVNCVETIFGGQVLAAGSMGGSLRFYDADTGQTLAVRRHSDASGPVLALLELALSTPGQDSRMCSLPPSEPSSPRSNDSEARHLPNARSRAGSWPKEKEGPLEGTASSPEAIAGKTLSAQMQVLRQVSSERETSRPSALLLSASNNELRVWDTEGFANSGGSSPSRHQVDVPCLFCFRFSPNQGQLLTIAGNFCSVVLGFQSTRVFRLRLGEGWNRLMNAKSRSRQTRYFTFNVDYKPPADQGSPQSQLGAADGLPHRGCLGKWSNHSLLEALHNFGEGHIGFVHCLVHEPKTDFLASGGGDGRLIFWGRQEPAKDSPPCSRRSAQWVLRRPPFVHGGAVLALAYSHRLGELFSADARGRIRIWDCAAVERGSRVVLQAKDGVAVLSLALVEAPSGEALLLAGDAIGMLRIWDYKRSVVLREVNTQMTCCAALCALNPVMIPGAAPGSNWLIRVAMGGCGSGDVKIADVSVEVPTDTEGGSNLRLCFLEGACSAGAADCEPASAEDASEFRRLLTLLADLVAIPTVSSNPQHALDMQRGTSWLAQLYEELLGCTVRVSGNCIVARFGWDETKPLVAMYSHYDVVAVGQGWNSDPWQITAVDGHLYGRGVNDNKGPLLAQIFAVRKLTRRCLASQASSPGQSFTDVGGQGDFFMRVELDDGTQALAGPASPKGQVRGCPVNVLFIADGGEEVGDVATVRKALSEAREDGWLRGGVAGFLVNNSSWVDDERPCICYGMRGVIDLEVRVVGGERDLHSGVHGGLVPEPMLDLMSICSSLMDATGVPAVPGFGDGVRAPCAEDLENLQAAARTLNASAIRQRLGLAEGAEAPSWLTDERAPGLEALRRTWLSPSLSITEVGKGPRHGHGRHIAHQASCVVSARTTPCQRHEDVIASLHRHLRHEFSKRRSPNRLEIDTLAVSDWWEARTVSHIYRAARGALAEVWGIEESAVFAVREGGTMAMLPVLEAELGCDGVQMGLTQASAAVHLPNERITTRVLARAVDAIASTLVRMGSALASTNDEHESAGAAAAVRPPCCRRTPHFK